MPAHSQRNLIVVLKSISNARWLFAAIFFGSRVAPEGRNLNDLGGDFRKPSATFRHRAPVFAESHFIRDLVASGFVDNLYKSAN